MSVPAIRRAVGYHGVRNDPLICYAVDALQLFKQFLYGTVLFGCEIFVVISHDFDADGVSVYVGFSLPHTASGMVCHAGAVDDTVDMATRRDKVMAFSILTHLIQRSLRGALCGVQDDVSSGFAQGAFRIARAV